MILIKVSERKYVLSVRRGVLGLGAIQWFTGIKPQRRRARGGRTTETNYYSEANMLLFSSADNDVNFTSLRTLRLIIVAL